MASVGYKKLKTAQAVKAMIRHCDMNERKKTKSHSNKDINLQATGSNLQLRNRDYETTCKMYDDKIEYLDSLEGANKRKDRVTCFGLNVPVPQGLQAKQEAEWFTKVSNIIKDQYGQDNLLQTYIHRDEKHTYKNSETGELCESRTHAHFYVVPEHNGKLNGKWFSSRANMNKLNNSIQDMTQSDYGLNFMDGSKRKSKKNVEQLKNESEYRALQEQLENERNNLDTREAHLKAQEDILQGKLKEITERDEKSLKLADEAVKMYDEAEQYYSQAQKWVSTQSQQHIKEREEAAEREKRRLKQLTNQFADITRDYNKLHQNDYDDYSM